MSIQIVQHAGWVSQVAPRALTGTVVAYKGSFGFVEYALGDQRPRVYFTAGDAEPNLALPLRPGDEVTFTLAVKPDALGQNPKSGFCAAGAAAGREVIARRVRRTREAPSGKENADAFVAERNPAAQKFTGNLDAGAGRGNQTMRMARGPDGTRGFAGAGRGRGLGLGSGQEDPASATPAAPGAPVAAAAPAAAPAPDLAAAPPDEMPATPAPPTKAKTAPGLAKTSSGTLLNPGASEFVPRSYSGGSLKSLGSGADGAAAERPAAPSRLGGTIVGQPAAEGAAAPPDADAHAA